MALPLPALQDTSSSGTPPPPLPAAVLPRGAVAADGGSPLRGSMAGIQGAGLTSV